MKYTFHLYSFSFYKEAFLHVLSYIISYETMVGSPNPLLWVSRLKLREVQYLFRVVLWTSSLTLSLKCEQQLLPVPLPIIKTCSQQFSSGSHSPFLTVLCPRAYSSWLTAPEEAFQKIRFHDNSHGRSKVVERQVGLGWYINTGIYQLCGLRQVTRPLQT